MEIFKNAPVLWFIAGFLFFLLEFIIPGLILFFFAVGAWIVAILSLFIDMTINMQLYIFLGSTIITILLFRKWMTKKLWARKHASEIENEFLGKTAKAETFISIENNGKVNFRGTSWDAKSDDKIEPGENVIITGNESILLIVKSTKSLT